MYAQTNGWMGGRTDNGHKAMTIARWPSVSGAKKSDTSQLKTFAENCLDMA